MPEHPIEKLMDSTMDNIKGMIDVNTIVGDPVETAAGSIIVPISRVSFGFASGGADYSIGNGKEQDSGKELGYPFGGGSGAGVTLNPVAFLVVSKHQVRLLPVTGNAVLERLINVAPELMDQFREMLEKRRQQL